eukprot:11390302-Prorocentrum_lima.AAC.1
MLQVLVNPPDQSQPQLLGQALHEAAPGQPKLQTAGTAEALGQEEEGTAAKTEKHQTSKEAM